VTWRNRLETALVRVLPAGSYVCLYYPAEIIVPTDAYRYTLTWRGPYRYAPDYYCAGGHVRLTRRGARLDFDARLDLGIADAWIEATRAPHETDPTPEAAP